MCVIYIYCGGVLNVRCMAGSYTSPTGTVRVDFESSPNEHRVTDDVPSQVIDDSVTLVKLQPPISVSSLHHWHSHGWACVGPCPPYLGQGES